MRRSGIGRVWMMGILIATVVGLASAPAAEKKANGAPEAKTVGGMAVLSPESVGFSSARLENLHALIQGEVDRKELAGAITLLARHGKVVDFRTYGAKDIATQAPMTYDTIFRDYSMTKPVTGVAMMILYEQGKWLPWDPISKYIPAFKDLKVFDGFDKDGKMLLAEPIRQPSPSSCLTRPAFPTGTGMGRSMRYTSRPSRCNRTICNSLWIEWRSFRSTTSRAGLDVLRFHGYRRVHRRKAERRYAPGLYAEAYLRAVGHEGCGILCAPGQADALCH